MKKKIIVIVGLSVLLVDLLFVTRAFILAYLSPSKTYTMNINNYNEAIPELVFVLLLFPLGLFVVFDKVAEVRRQAKCQQ